MEKDGIGEKMVSKNNFKLLTERQASKKRTYAVKKLSIGVVSVVVGTTFYMTGVLADEKPADVKAPLTEKTMETGPTKETVTKENNTTIAEPETELQKTTATSESTEESRSAVNVEPEVKAVAPQAETLSKETDQHPEAVSAPVEKAPAVETKIGENLSFDGSNEVIEKNSETVQNKQTDLLQMDSGTVTFRYRLANDDQLVRNSSAIALLSISNENATDEYASFFIDTKSNKIGLEFKGKPVIRMGSGFNYLSNTDWQTISYVFNGSTVTVYLNGEKYGEAAFDGMLSDLSWKDKATTLTLGGLKRQYGGSKTYQWDFKGVIDECSVSSSVFDQTQIKDQQKATDRTPLVDKYGLWDKYEEDIFEYRIPSIVKTPQGTLVAASDARKKHHSDWGDIATVVRVSHDDGKTWSKNIPVLDLATQPYFMKDYATTENNAQNKQSAFSIDSALLTDSNGKLYMLVDVFPESQGTVNVQAGSGYERIAGKDYLNLYDFSGAKYTVREDGNVYDDKGNLTDMYVSEGEFATAFKTKGDLYRRVAGATTDEYLGNIYLRSGRDAKGNITQQGTLTAPLTTKLTDFLWLLTSDDQGQTWSAPVDLTPQIKEDWMSFLGTGAAAGVEVDAIADNGQAVKRLVFPIYYTNQHKSGALGRQSSANIYSDDGGKTWQRGESPNDGRIYGDGQQTTSKDFDTEVTELTENQILQLNNGHLLQFMRNTGRTVVIAKSTDGGKTWEDNLNVTDLPEPYVNLSAIHLMFNGKEYIALSNPLGNPAATGLANSRQRYKGILRIGEVLENDDINWIASELFEPKSFVYSSLVQLDEKTLGMLYENEGHIKYTTFDIAKMLADQAKFDVIKIKEVHSSVKDKKVTVTIETDQPVFVNGSRILDVKVGDQKKQAYYISGTGTDTLNFEFELAGDEKGQLTIDTAFKGSVITNKYGYEFNGPATYKLGYIGKAVPGARIAELFDAQVKDNTWVFTGGAEVKGGFEQTAGIRNYVGQFEEYIRWTRSETELGRQRYVINTAQAGLTLAQINEKFDELVTNYHPKAVGYLVGSEELEQNSLTDFEKSVKEFIKKGLQGPDGKERFVILQGPHASNDLLENQKRAAYQAVLDKILANWEDQAELERIIVVDHFSKTDNEEFKQECLDKDGSLNARGHLMIGSQLAAATIKTKGDFPGKNVELDLVPTKKTHAYSEQCPQASYQMGTLKVVLPAENVKNWQYELKFGETILSDKGTGTTFEITDLPMNEEYELKVYLNDESLKLGTVTGKFENGNSAQTKKIELNENQQRLQEILKGKTNWLFMGDSITHAAAWTLGYDGVAQAFEKYLTTSLGRNDDVVINTAVSGATVASTLEHLDERLDKYEANVVTIMLGTNDAANANLTAEQYRKQILQLVQKIRQKNALIVLRTPTPAFSGARAKKLPEFIEVLREIAAEEPDIILIDQYTPFAELVEKYPYLKQPENLLFTDGIPLHPGPNGQLMMVKQYIDALGLTDPRGSALEDLEYQVTLDNVTLKGQAGSVIDQKTHQIKVSAEKLATLAQEKLEDITLFAKVKGTDKVYQSNDLQLKNLPDGSYEVWVTAKAKNEPKLYRTKLSEVQLGESGSASSPDNSDNSNSSETENSEVPMTPEQSATSNTSEQTKKQQVELGIVSDRRANNAKVTGVSTVLPQTGEKQQNWLGIFGTTLLSLLGVLGLNSRRKNRE